MTDDDMTWICHEVKKRLSIEDMMRVIGGGLALPRKGFSEQTKEEWK